MKSRLLTARVFRSFMQVLDRLSAGLVPPHWVPQGVLGHGGSRLQAEGPSLPAWRAAVQVRGSRCSPTPFQPPVADSSS